MYRDKTLIPTEAVRLAALGFLAGGPARYGEVAREVREFTSRIIGPSLDVLGTSIELLRFEGLIEAVNGEGTADDAELRITDAGRKGLEVLLTSRVRTPVDGVNRLVFALKIRYLHLLEPARRAEQIDLIVEMSEQERVRLLDLAKRHRGEQGHLSDWIALELDQIQARIAWLRRLDLG